ncbi:MAG TPA: flagellar motor protein MotB [Gammaproteobacteria bacterium]|nr:flagellar motor protein MotB [Gammaproteobacteria bacterium]
MNGRGPSPWLRAPVEDEDHGRDRWMVSYADFITLLLAFFVVLYSISSINDGKFRVLSNSIVTVFNDEVTRAAPIDMGGGAPPQTGMLDGSRNLAEVEQPTGEDSVRALSPATIAPPAVPTVGTPRERIEAVLAPFGEAGEVKVRDTRDWLEIELGAELLFDSGSAAIDPAALPMIDRIAGVVADMGRPARVEGFTDDVPLAGGPYGSNWGLSAARAASIADRLARARVAPEKLAAVGYGEYRPVADNATEEGRRKNRRVVVAIAKHDEVSILAGEAAADAATLPEQTPAPAPTLQRVTELPGPAEIGP